MFKKLTAFILTRLGYRLEKCDFSRPPIDMEKGFEDICIISKKYTLTSVERMYALYKAVEYVINAGIQGDIVEAGVWKGGSMMLAALTLQKFDDTRRKIYLYDTYAGMTKPGEKDVMSANQYPAKEKWNDVQKNKAYKDIWFCYASLEEVKNNLKITKYPEEKLIFVKGDVEKTIPEKMPEKIAILRLDTDWYASTKHVLKHLFPKIVSGGVLIIDDYGHWQGAKDAVEEYFIEQNKKIFLIRVDKTGRVGIKI